MLADLGWEAASGEVGASELPALKDGDLLAGAAVRSGAQATQAQVPNRSRLRRFERELDEWFTEFAADAALLTTDL